MDSRVQPDAEKDSRQSLPVSAGVTSIPDRCPTDSFIGEAGKLRDRASECEALRGWSRLWVAARVGRSCCGASPGVGKTAQPDRVLPGDSVTAGPRQATLGCRGRCHPSGMGVTSRRWRCSPLA